MPKGRKREDQLTAEQKKMISDRISNAFVMYCDKHPGTLQKDIAAMIGLSHTSFSRILSSDSNITIANIMKISKALNVNMDYLVGFSDSMSTDLNDKAISKSLKLSDEAIKQIKDLSDKKEIKALDTLLKSPLFLVFIQNLKKILFSSDEILSGKVLLKDNKEELLNAQDIRLIYLEKIKISLQLLMILSSSEYKSEDIEGLYKTLMEED